MSIRKTSFVEGCFCHVYNRGVEKSDIFLEEADYKRFMYLLFVCNDTKPVLNSRTHYRGEASIQEIVPRDKLVDIISFCLMSNHFHLVLRQIKDKGISIFMQKLGTGYTMYFNVKRERSGSLFQGPFKAIHVDKQNYLDRVITYVHLNPADLIEPKWKESGIKNWQRTHNFVKEYVWSSYGDYLGIGKFRNIINLNLVQELFGNFSDTTAKSFVERGVGYLKNYVIE